MILDIKDIARFVLFNPLKVFCILKKHGWEKDKSIKSINEGIIELSDNQSFIKDLFFEMEGRWFNFVDPVSLALGATAFVASVSSATLGVINSKNLRQKQEALQLLEQYQNNEQQLENIQQMTLDKEHQILLGVIAQYKTGASLENGLSNNYRNSVIFFSIFSLSTAFLLRTLIVKL